MGRKKSFITKICPICKSNYEVNQNNKREMEQSKTCGILECRKKLVLINTNYNLICFGCGKSFVGKRINQKFCSKKCQTKRYKLVCVICASEFYSDKNVTKTCSHKCRWALNRSQLVGLICSYCEKSFSRPAYTVRDSKVFCSKSCNNKFFVELNYGTTNKYGKNWSRIREYMFEFYDFRCQKCLEKYDINTLRLHHIIPFRFFESLDQANLMMNLLPLCDSCHIQVHQKYDEWLNKEFGEKKIWSELYSDIERIAEMTIPHTF
ncbi:HNH endonuclease [Bacillus sp. Xin]|uniref:HNH endonuclease n=1 Tax=unclassified Bacillus (in: firmicutes) TaxID=185979 RepID=UPI00157284C6|nr:MULTISPECIES: HNH endonuclease signature motif containing protein [unclassified Bacillus (in: firmicutes)]MBC6975720.1 HNH endonuclease [Bacillus sp. Xin]NSW35277.1 HNH endonuclease [Bacillus sp. Xin1]